MHELLDSILVIGHHNPDTDAAASAAAYAHFLNAIGRYDRPAVASVLGHLTPQTQHVFKIANVEPPILLENITPRVGHAMTRHPATLSVDDRLGEAFERIVREDVSMLPIVDQDGRLAGCFSNRSDTTRFLMGFDPSHFWGELLNVDDLASMPGMRKVGETDPQHHENSTLRVALDGDRSWFNEVSPTDVLVCGSLQTIDEISDARLPQCVVEINTTDQRGTQRLARLNKLGKALLQYDQGIASFLGTLALRMRLGCLSLPSGMCVGELDQLSDIQGLFNESHHALPVVDHNNKLLGVIGRRDLATSECCKAILVDHFELPQAVQGVEAAEILEILDHHRVGDLETCNPALVQCHPVGSSCTIVANNFFLHQVELTKSVATLLLGGLIADTLLLTSPTTTETDHHVAQRLAEIVEIDLQEFGREVLTAGDDLITADPAAIWQRDRKEFCIRDQSVSIAQLETTSLTNLSDERLEAFRELARKDHETSNRSLSLLVVTDVLLRHSWISAFESSDIEGTVRTALSTGACDPKPGWISAPGLVSRKKQIVPQLMMSLATV